MNKTKKGFGQELDLGNYEGRWSQEECNNHTKRGVFVKFSYMYIGDLDYSDEQLHNAAIRANGNKDRADEKIKHSYSRVGWKYNDFPPIVGTDGKIRDGRTRIRAAILAGWKSIPVAIFSYDVEVNEEFSDVVDGLIANDHQVARRATTKDFITAGVNLVGKGYINQDQASIDDWLYNVVGIERFYSNIAGTITKISKAILAQSTPNGDPIIVDKNREEWVKYLTDCKEVKALDIVLPEAPNPLNENQLVFYSTGKTNARRCWVDQILGNTTHNYHTYIVLYSTEKTAEKLRQEMKNFANDLEMFYAQTVKLINSQLSGIQIALPEQRPFTIVGAIPQFADDETHKELRILNRLIPLDQL